MHQRGIGLFAKMINASKLDSSQVKSNALTTFSIVPVIRPQDLAKEGEGRIQLLNRKTDPLRIIGIDTKFTTQLKPRDSIMLPKGSGISEVVQVISDTEVLIKKEFKELRALALLTSNEGSPFKCVPHIEQDSVYKCVHDELNNGRGITIFPEGGSHDRAEILPLKGNLFEQKRCVYWIYLFTFCWGG